MAIKNKTKNKIIANKIRYCRNPLDKFIGVMFHKKIKDKGLIFIFKKEKRISLHMFFVFFAIDVLFLDKNKKIIEIKEKFKPFNLYKTKKKVKYIVELPQDSIKKSKTKINDKIEF